MFILIILQMKPPLRGWERLERGTARSSHAQHRLLLKAGLKGRENLLHRLDRNRIVCMNQAEKMGRFVYRHTQVPCR